MRVTYTQPARAAVTHILGDLYEINPDAAATLSQRIEATVTILRQFP